MTTNTLDLSSPKTDNKDMNIKDYENITPISDTISANSTIIGNNRTEKKSCFRWFILVQYSSCLFVLFGFTQYVSPVSDSIQKGFNVSIFTINLFNTPISILGFFTYFINIYFAVKFGVKWSILAGIILMILGGVINLFIETNYYYTVAGCTIQFLGISLFNSVFGEVSFRWFSDGERPLAVAIMMLFQELSYALNTVLPSLMIKSGKEVSSETIINDTLYYNIYRIAAPIFFFLVFCIFFKEWPTKKSSKNKENLLIENEGKDAINEDISIKQKFDFKEFRTTLCKLFSDKVYLYLNIGFSSGYAAASAFVNVAGELHSAFGYDESLVD